MRNLWKYLLIGLLALGLVAIVAVPFLIRGYGGYGLIPAFTPGAGMGPGMMGRFGHFPILGGFGVFGMVMMLLGFLVPVGLIVLAAFGVVALFRRPGAPVPPPPAAPSRTCSNCGRPAQADWTTCPYCGQKLS